MKVHVHLAKGSRGEKQGIDTSALRVQEKLGATRIHCLFPVHHAVRNHLWFLSPSCCGHGGLFTIADHGIGQSVLERSEPGLVVPPLEEPLADNRLADLL